MQKENTRDTRRGGRATDGVSGQIRRFIGVMRGVSRMLEAAHYEDANPGLRDRDGSRVWEPVVTEMPAGGDLVLYFELPDVEREDIDLSVRGDSLTVSGVKKEVPSLENVTVEDFISGSLDLGPVEHVPFKRTVTLPAPVRGGSVEAALGAGILNVRLAGVAGDRTRRIYVRGKRRRHG